MSNDFLIRDFLPRPHEQILNRLKKKHKRVAEDKKERK